MSSANNIPAQSVQQRSKRAQSVQNFTLVEVVVVFLLVGIAFAAASRLLSFNMWLADHAQSRTVALSVAKNRLEDLRTVTFSTLCSYAEEQVQVNAHGIPDVDGLYLRTTQFESPDGPTQQVTVTVSAGGKLGRPGVSVSLTTSLLDMSIIIPKE